ncbi:MAG: hypothetical protein V3W19_01715 [Desulfatiglandales bacterium]
MKSRNSAKGQIFSVEPQKRFGSIAVEKGFITPNQLIEALRAQINQEIITGKHRLLGEILSEMGHITTDQIDEVLESQVEEPYEKD